MPAIETGSDLIPDAHRDGGVVTCRVAEDLTLKNVAWAKVVFGKLVRDYHPEALVIDLSAVSFIDSAGLATLVLARKLMTEGGRVVLRGAAQPVRGLIRIAHLDRIFDFDDGPDAGIRG